MLQLYYTIVWVLSFVSLRKKKFYIAEREKERERERGGGGGRENVLYRIAFNWVHLFDTM